MTRRSTVIVVRHSPYGNSLAKSALDTALAAAAFEAPLSVLFLGDGVLQLLPDQDGSASGVKNIGKQLASFPLYDIDEVFVDALAVAQYGLALDAAPLPATALDENQIHALLSEADHLIGF